MSDNSTKIIRAKSGLEYILCPDDKLCVKSYAPENIAERLRIPSCIKISDSDSELHNVVAIGPKALCNAPGLKKIVVGRAIEHIWDEAFACVTNLEEIVIYNCDSLREIPDYCFYGCTSLKSIELPIRVNFIGGSAFEKCTNLESLIASHINVELAAGAFENCTSLVELDGNFFISGEDAEGVFKGCKSLKEVRLYIAEDCDKELYLPPRIFAGCESLEHVSLYSIPATGKKNLTICADAFKGCKSLKVVDGSFGNLDIDSLDI